MASGLTRLIYHSALAVGHVREQLAETSVQRFAEEAEAVGLADCLAVAGHDDGAAELDSVVRLVFWHAAVQVINEHHRHRPRRAQRTGSVFRGPVLSPDHWEALDPGERLTLSLWLMTELRDDERPCGHPATP